MYNPYIAYVEKYVPNAVPVVDSFHVIQWITRSIDSYIRQLIKKYRHEIFRDFASLLEKYEDPIINSFLMVERIGNGKSMMPVFLTDQLNLLIIKPKSSNGLDVVFVISSILETDFSMPRDPHWFLMVWLTITLLLIMKETTFRRTTDE